MDQVERFDFSEMLLPHGEDKISYAYEAGDLRVSIHYDDCQSKIELIFKGCSYQYFAPVPGYFPFEKRTKQGPPKSGCVYENCESELLDNSEQIGEQAGFKRNSHHFSFYLEWANVSVDVIANQFDYEKSQII